MSMEFESCTTTSSYQLPILPTTNHPEMISSSIGQVTFVPVLCYSSPIHILIDKRGEAWGRSGYTRKIVGIDDYTQKHTDS